MCLTTKEYKTRRELREDAKKIAKEDIKVYKVLKKSNVSPHRQFLWYKGYHYTDKLQKEVSGGGEWKDPWTITITRGLHAFTSHKIAKNSYTYNNNYYNKIVTMYIPKGSEYYLGINGDIVSNNLIWY